MSSVTLRPAVVVYREEQHFAWWIYAILLVMVALALLLPTNGQPMPVKGGNGWGLHVPLGLAVGLALPSVLVLGVLRMTTEVTPAGVQVWFGWIPTSRHVVPLTTIERLEVVHFRPLADYGFWGIRWGPDGERVLIARGNRGVRLHLSDGSRLLIGSQKPEALAVALEKAMRPEP